MNIYIRVLFNWVSQNHQALKIKVFKKYRLFVEIFDNFFSVLRPFLIKNRPYSIRQNVLQINFF